MEVIYRLRLSREDAVEGLSGGMSPRPYSQTIPSFVDQLGVFEQCQILGRPDRDEGVEGITVLRRLVPSVVQRLAVVWLEWAGKFPSVHA